jgi:lipopolysaccharide transport system ATP-binding protein
MLTRLRRLVLGDPEVPTVMHLTHAKAGSTWVYNILQHLLPTRVAERGPRVAKAVGGDLSKHVFDPGKIYPAMFMSRDQFLAHPELRDIHRFVVIRDLRDTLVSLYFSLKISHPLDDSGRKKMERDKLQALSEEDGFLWLFDEHAVRLSHIQRSWAGSGENVYKYEDLLQNDVALFEEILIQKCQLPISRYDLKRVLKKVGFETVFKRKLGEEDVHSHGRKGTPGDWQNHFTPRLREEFLKRYQDVLVATGYEKDASWVNS